MAVLFLWNTIFTALFLAVSSSSNPDTYGYEFVFVYPPNNSGPDGTNATMDIINPDTRKHAAVVVEYSEFDGFGDNITSKRFTISLEIKILTSISFQFNGSVILGNIKDGLHQYLDARIVVSSSVPISLVAHSVDASGARDSFLVLPTSFAQKRYALALPPSSLFGSTIVYFLPTTAAPDQQINIRLIRSTSSCSCTQTVQVGEMLAFSSSEESITLWAHSSVKFVVVAAVRGLPTARLSDILDFGCFMPSPIPMNGCGKLSVQDDHVAQILTGRYYLLTTPSAYCESVEIVIRGSNNNTEKKHVESGIVETPELLPFDELGNIAAISSTHGFIFFFAYIDSIQSAAMLNVIRYGGYNVGEINYEEGAYLHEVPAISQFVTGMTPVVVPTDSNQLTVIADYKAMSSVYFDGEISMTFAPLPFFGGSLYYASGTVQPGFHFLYADGLYIVFVTGRTNNSAYGFVPAFNSRKIVKPLSTTTAPLTKSTKSTTVTSGATATLSVTKTKNATTITTTKATHTHSTDSESTILSSTTIPQTITPTGSSAIVNLSSNVLLIYVLYTLYNVDF